MKLGKLLWYLQRYSAIYFLLFLGYIGFIVFTDGFSFELISDNLKFKILSSLFIIFACMHAFVGLWTIGTDYLTKRTLGFISLPLSAYANFIRKSFEFFFVFLGFFLVVFYLLIIWS